MNTPGPIDDRRIWTPDMMPDAVVAQCQANPELAGKVDWEELRARLNRHMKEARESGMYIFPDDPDYPATAPKS